jgi:hypothetical protein
MAAYVTLRVPATSMARLYGAIAVLATYIIVRRIATAIGMEYLNDGKGSGAVGQRGGTDG